MRNECKTGQNCNRLPTWMVAGPTKLLSFPVRDFLKNFRGTSLKVGTERNYCSLRRCLWKFQLLHEFTDHSKH